jgi:iron complex transport system ATP-binding protein
LAQQTPVIYLDEPTAFLDYPSKVEVLQLLSRISREAGKVIFLSTHDVELALQMADTIWLMTSGEAMAIGSPKMLAEQGALSRFIERDGIKFDKESMAIKVTKRI